MRILKRAFFRGINSMFANDHDVVEKDKLIKQERERLITGSKSLSRQDSTHMSRCPQEQT